MHRVQSKMLSSVFKYINTHQYSNACTNTHQYSDVCVYNYKLVFNCVFNTNDDKLKNQKAHQKIVEEHKFYELLLLSLIDNSSTSLYSEILSSLMLLPT